jgi:hypothetical protein
MTDARLQELLAVAAQRMEQMSPSEQLRMWYEQRRSFARGMCPDSRDFAEHCKVVDRLSPPAELLTDAEIGLVLLGQYRPKKEKSA